MRFRILTFRKFLHWRSLQLSLVLLVTSACTTLILWNGGGGSLIWSSDKSAPFRTRWTSEEWDLPCETVPQIACEQPAFTSEWSIIPDVDIQLYSAHLDDRLQYEGRVQNFIRVIGLLRKSAASVRLYCQASYSSGRRRTTRAFLDKVWHDSWDNANSSDLLTPHILSCHYDTDVQEHPNSVSILTDPCACPTNSLRLRRSRRRSSNPIISEAATLGAARSSGQKNFMVCVKGVFFSNKGGGNDDHVQTGRSAALQQWLEMLYILGASHIHMYLYGVPKSTRKMLKFYERYRPLTLQKLTLPPREYPQGAGFLEQFLDQKTWEKRRLELVPYNDCYYRYKDSHKYIVLLDVDELIIPRDPDATTWSTLMDNIFELDSSARSRYSSFAFPNAYFFRAPGSQQDVLRQFDRSANISRPGFAVKSIFDSDGSLAVFNHYTLIPLRPDQKKCAIIGSDIGLLHHYRDSCPRKMEKECEEDLFKFKVFDATMLKYERSLKQAIANTKQDMKNAMF